MIWETEFPALAYYRKLAQGKISTRQFNALGRAELGAVTTRVDDDVERKDTLNRQEAPRVTSLP